MPESEKKKSIVILENEEQFSRVAALKLTIEGYDVKVISNAKEFFTAIKKNQPDLVLLDLVMDESNGFDVLSKMKKDAKLKKIKAMIYSSLSQDDDRKKALDLGAEDYMVKSEITLKELVKKVNEVI